MIVGKLLEPTARVEMDIVMTIAKNTTIGGRAVPVATTSTIGHATDLCPDLQRTTAPVRIAMKMNFVEITQTQNHFPLAYTTELPQE
jgi:hypothetical protein